MINRLNVNIYRGLYNRFYGFKIAFMTHKKNLKKKKTQKHKNKEEKYIPIIVLMVGLIKTSTMDFTNIKLPK